jgi:hypothetical protein
MVDENVDVRTKRRWISWEIRSEDADETELARFILVCVCYMCLYVSYTTAIDGSSVAVVSTQVSCSVQGLEVGCTN